MGRCDVDDGCVARIVNLACDMIWWSLVKRSLGIGYLES